MRITVVTVVIGGNDDDDVNTMTKLKLSLHALSSLLLLQPLCASTCSAYVVTEGKASKAQSWFASTLLNAWYNHQ